MADCTSYKIGDVVRMKSGGPKMVVEAVAPGKVTVWWFDHDGTPYKAIFPPEILKAHNPHDLEG